MASRLRDVGGGRPRRCAPGRPAGHARPGGVAPHSGRACQQPEDYGRWTVRTLARDLELPPATVHSVLVASGLQPHRIRTFTFRPDPDFEAKLLDIVGLYLQPPENALVLCVDEKSGIQALDRTQPGLPLRARHPRTRTNEYVRNGTQALIAALEVATGRVIGHVKDKRTSVNFLRFMTAVVAAFPDRVLHVVLDNLNIHKNAAADRWLARHPLVHFHYTPTHASWVNLIECFFSILGKQGLSQRVDRSTTSLRAFLLQYLEKYNETSAPFTWTKGPEKLQHIIEATKAAHGNGLIPKRRRRKRRRHRPADKLKN
jgi:transposase